ncbi:conserved hypothetical protein [Agrobacterium tomkonis CFBP 6623]|uniref:Uncharacterized protein n=1 Tax=Agrobacterium tomkonis CFBP 6623 TaxID=1183432 RepID=A0A1S7NW77_9HYPH|nr:conserved hypothetical protein [Agrobacterium tomkonis CFBP 6623]
MPVGRHGTALTVELLDAGRTAGSTLSTKILNHGLFTDFTRPKTGLPKGPDVPPRHA